MRKFIFFILIILIPIVFANKEYFEAHSKYPILDPEPEEVLHKKWNEWKIKFNKEYLTNEEEQFRYKNWCRQYKQVRLENGRYPERIGSPIYNLNTNSDRTTDELRTMWGF